MPDSKRKLADRGILQTLHLFGKSKTIGLKPNFNAESVFNQWTEIFNVRQNE
jgi:hypothetical protein